MRTKRPSNYLKKPYSRILIPEEEGGYSAEILEFPGCVAEGETADETLQNLEAAAQSWIEVALSRNLEIPEPFLNQGYGGKIALRLPRSLHRQATRFAQRDGTSLNQFLVSAVAARVGAEDVSGRITDRLEQRLAMTATAFVTIASTAIQQKLSAMPALDEPLVFQGTAQTIQAGVMTTHEDVHAEA